MKKSLQFTAFLLGVIMAFSSCKSSQEAIAQRRKDIEQSKEPNTTCFVVFKDGSTRQYNSLKLVTGIFKTPFLLTDNKVKIHADEICAYQNKEHYAISQANFVSGHKTYIGKEALPGFAIRIAKGKINVYTKKYFNGSKAINEYFVQKGEDGKIMAYTAETMNLLVKDDTEALDFFVAKKYTTPKSKKDPVIATSYVANDKKLKRNK